MSTNIYVYCVFVRFRAVLRWKSEGRRWILFPDFHGIALLFALAQPLMAVVGDGGTHFRKHSGQWKPQ